MQVTYYAFLGILSLLGVYYVFSGLFGSFRLRNAPPALAKGTLLLAACAAIGCLYQAYQAGEIDHYWGRGLAWTLGAFFVFQTIMVAGAFLFGNKSA